MYCKVMQQKYWQFLFNYLPSSFPLASVKERMTPKMSYETKADSAVKIKNSSSSKEQSYGKSLCLIFLFIMELEFTVRQISQKYALIVVFKLKNKEKLSEKIHLTWTNG